MFDAAAALMHSIFSPPLQDTSSRRPSVRPAAGGIGQSRGKKKAPVAVKAGAATRTSPTLDGFALLFLGEKTPAALAEAASGLECARAIAEMASRTWQTWNAKAAGASPSDFDTPLSPGVQVQLEHIPDAPAAPSQSASGAYLLGTNFWPAGDRPQADLARLLLEAMIAAAKADNCLPHETQIRISSGLIVMGISPAERHFVDTEMAKPRDMDALIDRALRPELAATLYLASVLMMTGESFAQKDYLALLSSRLRLAPDLVAELHAVADAAA